MVKSARTEHGQGGEHAWAGLRCKVGAALGLLLSVAALTLPEAVSVPPFSSRERRGEVASEPEALQPVSYEGSPGHAALLDWQALPARLHCHCAPSFC